MTDVQTGAEATCRHERAGSGAATRRAVFGGAGALGAACVLAACGTDQTGSSGDNEPGYTNSPLPAGSAGTDGNSHRRHRRQGRRWRGARRGRGRARGRRHHRRRLRDHSAGQGRVPRVQQGLHPSGLRRQQDRRRGDRLPVPRQRVLHQRRRAAERPGAARRCPRPRSRWTATTWSPPDPRLDHAASSQMPTAVPAARCRGSESPQAAGGPTPWRRRRTSGRIMSGGGTRVGCVPDPSSYRPAPGHHPRRARRLPVPRPSGRVIYVGKAKSLRSRLNSYFADIWYAARAHPADGHHGRRGRLGRRSAPRSRRCSWSTAGSRSSTPASTSSTATTSRTRASRSR